MSDFIDKKRDEEISDSSSDAFRHEENAPAPREERLSSQKGALFFYTVFALGLALFIRFFIAAPYVVSGSSMEPNFDNWDYLITDRLSYRFSMPERGDVVVFNLPHESSRTLIKRVIGLPGETVEVQGNVVRITNTEHPEGFVLAEPYLASENLGGPPNIKMELTDNDFFVLGDNRRVSSDSRTWGALPKDDIIGRVLLRLFPLSNIGVFPAKAHYLEE